MFVWQFQLTLVQTVRKKSGSISVILNLRLVHIREQRIYVNIFFFNKSPLQSFCSCRLTENSQKMLLSFIDGSGKVPGANISIPYMNLGSWIFLFELFPWRKLFAAYINSVWLGKISLNIKLQVQKQTRKFLEKFKNFWKFVGGKNRQILLSKTC